MISLIALVGNMLLLSLAIWLMAAGAPVLLVTIGMGIIISCVNYFIKMVPMKRRRVHLQQY